MCRKDVFVHVGDDAAYEGDTEQEQPQEPGLICPLRMMAVEGREAAIQMDAASRMGIRLAECLKERCAWWDEVYSWCCVKSTTLRFSVTGKVE